MDPLIKSQLLYQLSYAPILQGGPGWPAAEAARLIASSLPGRKPGSPLRRDDVPAAPYSPPGGQGAPGVTQSSG